MSYSKNTDSESTSHNKDTHGFGFVVHGKVQGVFFRKFTKKQAQSLQLKGWVQNTPEGTVRGQVVGSSSKDLDQMRTFLTQQGSPQSRIDHVDFTGLTSIQVQDLMTQDGFVVLKTPRS